MKTRDFMTSSVVSVTPDLTVNQVARVLLEHGISAARSSMNGENQSG